MLAMTAKNAYILDIVNRLRALRGMRRLYWRQGAPVGPPCGGEYRCGGMCPDCY